MTHFIFGWTVPFSSHESVICFDLFPDKSRHDCVKAVPYSMALKPVFRHNCSYVLVVLGMFCLQQPIQREAQFTLDWYYSKTTVCLVSFVSFSFALPLPLCLHVSFSGGSIWETHPRWLTVLVRSSRRSLRRPSSGCFYPTVPRGRQVQARWV